MAAYQGIQDTKKDILGQNKIQKVKFEDRIESMEPQHIEIKNDIDEKTQNNKQLKNKTEYNSVLKKIDPAISSFKCLFLKQNRR